MSISLALCLLLPPVGGFLLDRLLGDPPRLYHPVRLIGGLIARLEGLLRRIFPKTSGGERAGGVILAITVPLLTLIAAGGLLWGAYRLDWRLWLLLETWLCYRVLASRSLEEESMLVHQKLAAGDLPGARSMLSRIVGRDTESLEQDGVIRAAVETVAENACDGVIAPLFYLTLGGAALSWCYKAVNTLDSMVGYKNERYRYFGTGSARLDDAANLLPARIAALLMIAVAGLSGLDGTGALNAWLRDRRGHPSPNSGQTESACAGALGIRLGGGASYFGVWRDKPAMGSDTRPPVPGDIPSANGLMLGASLLALMLFTAVRLLVVRAILC